MAESRLIDARGPRFAAAVTAVVLAVTLLLTPSVAAVLLLAVQALAFGAAAFLGIRSQPYGWFFRRFLAPRLGPAKAMEDPAPPRFAQTVGLVFVVAALVALSFNLTLVAQIAIGFALAAAFLNAVFKFCLGCEMYLLFQRIRSRRASRPVTPASAAAEVGDGDQADAMDRADSIVDLGDQVDDEPRTADATEPTDDATDAVEPATPERASETAESSR